MNRKIVSGCIILLLTNSFFIAFTPSSVKASDPTLIDNIKSLVNNVINWNYTDDESLGWNSIMTQAVELQFGKSNYTQLANNIDSLTNPLEVLEAYSVLEKLNLVTLNQTKIQWALDNIVMLPNGLPKNSYTSGQDSFSTYYRFTLQGFNYAQKYNYDLAKWNVTNAYYHFNKTVFNATHPGVLWIYGNDTSYTISYGPRYYDEAAETIDCFLIFYQLGITTALNDANNVCNWIFNNLWSGTNFNYALNWAGYECEASGFMQIILKLQHYNNATDNAKLTADLMNRYLTQQWNSPQWTSEGKSYYAAVHMHDHNSEVRLQNTLGAWSALHGIYSILPTDQKVNMRLMIQGNDKPAWRLIYDNSTLWNGSAFVNKDATWANAQAAILLMLLGIVPGSGSIAIPISEQFYEDTSNMIDPELYALDLTGNVLTVPVLNPGELTFIYGNTPVTFSFQTNGVYNITFSNDWNSIINANLISALPSNRLYINLPFDTVAAPAFSHLSGVYSSPQTVTLSCTTPGATIRYTTDGTEPLDTSTVYSSPIYAGASTTIKAKAFKDGMTTSDTATATYTISVEPSKVSAPTFNPSDDSAYASAISVTINCGTSGATIRYTLDGSEPTTLSTTYTRPISVSTNTTIKAKTFLTGMTDSDTASATYTFSSSSGSGDSGVDLRLVAAVVETVVIIAIAAVELYFKKFRR